MNRYVNICASLAVFLSGSIFSFAQGGYTVQGSVADAQGPIARAAVVEVGTSNSTSTGPDGGYSLTVASPDSPVEISCIGYASVTCDASQMPS